ncbi:MAG: cation:proton antiporter, partial [Chloroflexia bacterium]
MHEVELVLGLLLIVAVLVLLAEKIKLPYPILLVIGGLAIGFIPGLPRIEIEPGLIFLLFLPPIIQSAAYQTSIRDFKANFRSIMQLAIALPILTTV